VVYPRYRVKETYKQLNLADRESEIEARSVKVHGNHDQMIACTSQFFEACETPKRLKDTLVLLEKMIWRHGKCGYKLLRDIACPSKVRKLHVTALSSPIARYSLTIQLGLSLRYIRDQCLYSEIFLGMREELQGCSFKAVCASTSHALVVG
jgi:hypothetical protein